MRALLALPVLVAAFSAAVGAGASGLACGWRVVAGVPGTQLSAVAALADTDVWAVGVDGSRSVILHWNGARWSLAHSDLVALDVAAASANDVWVVGESSPDPRIAQPRSEHWDGRRWRIVPVPGRPGEYLRAASAVSSHNVWAVGAASEGPFVVHWNGTAWRTVASGPRNGLLHAIEMPWAVGTQGQTEARSSEDPLVVRIQGDRVRVIRTPSIDTVDENLLAVAADSPQDVWAVGSEDDMGGRAPLIQHLYRSKWLDESVVGLPTSETALTAVAAFSPSDVWVAGYHGFARENVLLARWDGGSWTQAPTRSGSLSDLSALSRHDIWAVGGSAGQSLVERYACG